MVQKYHSGAGVVKRGTDFFTNRRVLIRSSPRRKGRGRPEKNKNSIVFIKKCKILSFSNIRAFFGCFAD